MAWKGIALRILSEDEIEGAVCKGSVHCRVTGEHAPRYFLEAVNTETGESRRGKFCLRAGGGIAYALGMEFPPGPSRGRS